MEDIFDIIVIGSGPAGLTAAIYAARSNLSVFVVAGVEAGGQLIWTTDVEDYPGFPEVIQGPELIERMRAQAERLGAKFLNENVETITTLPPFVVEVGSQKFKARSVILATGASAKWLGIDSEQRLRAKGVSACAVCDGPFFREKEVAVVGGGDTALREALFLTRMCKKVYVIHRRDSLRAFQSLQEAAKANPKIEFIFESVVDEVLGQDKVSGVRIKNLKTEKTKDLEVQGLFIAIGHKPNTDFLKGVIDLDERGYIVLKEKSKTSVEGIFAAGDVHDFRYQQAVTAAGAGCIAALDAEEYLGEHQIQR